MKELEKKAFCQKCGQNKENCKCGTFAAVLLLRNAEEYFKKIANDSGFWGRSCSRQLDKIQSLQNEVEKGNLAIKENCDLRQQIQSLQNEIELLKSIGSFYEFAKQYITIKDAKGNEQKFSDRQLNEIKEMEEMINKGYELKFVHLRRGTELRWVKK